MLVDDRLQLTHELGVVAAGEVVLDPLLQASEAELFQAGDLGLREALVAKVGEGWASPEGKRLRELPFFPQAPKAVQVELALLDPQQVARRHGLQALLAEQLPEPRH